MSSNKSKSREKPYTNVRTKAFAGVHQRLRTRWRHPGRINIISINTAEDDQSMAILKSAKSTKARLQKKANTCLCRKKGMDQWAEIRTLDEFCEDCHHLSLILKNLKYETII